MDLSEEIDINKIRESFSLLSFKNGNLNNETYSLKIITTWLKNKDIKYKYLSSSMVDRYLIYEHGVVVTIGDREISIQTHPLIAGYAFAETLFRDDMLSDRRHTTPEKLFEFLEELLTSEIVKKE